MKIKEKIRNILYRKSLFIGLIILIIATTVIVVIQKKSSTTILAQSQTGSLQTNTSSPKTTINKEFNFSIPDVSSNFKYALDSAELKNEIIVKGQKAKAIEGRTFLIFTIKITNDNNQGIRINTRDFVRLSTNNNEWLAADIHNDPVEIQAISTKYTRLGFPVDINSKEFKIQVGEIEGKKEIIDLKFK